MQRSSSKPGGQLLTTKAPSGGPKALYDFLGGGKVADVVLWRNKRLSAGILAGFTVIWLLFEVVEYHFVTLLCHMAIAAILVAFIWSNVAALFGLSPPKIPEVRILSQQAFKEFVETLHPKLSRLVSILHRVAFGEDLKLLLFVNDSFPSWLLCSVLYKYKQFHNGDSWSALLLFRSLSLHSDAAGFIQAIRA
ncbi:reticulon-like protein B6 isoform X2 [Elaeis guineensis]|uniref:reticulon-like protein B6 isoform X2 n=1 Tax=Elaeis guineensis var. tenera TaxID=51953 RepID=UPI003C6DB2ED